MKTKTIKINIYYNKRGNTYSVRSINECIEIICNKLGINTNPPIDSNYVKNVMDYQMVEKQVLNQYDCNKREIIFNIIF